MSALVLHRILNTVSEGFFCPLLFNINMIDLFYECEENELQTLVTTQLPNHVLLIFPLSFLNYRLSQQKFLIGLAMIMWNSNEVNVTNNLVLKILKLYLLMEFK